MPSNGAGVKHDVTGHISFYVEAIDCVAVAAAGGERLMSDATDTGPAGHEKMHCDVQSRTVVLRGAPSAVGKCYNYATEATGSRIGCKGGNAIKRAPVTPVRRVR